MNRIKKFISFIYTSIISLKIKPRCTFVEFFFRFLSVKKSRIVFSSFCGDNCSCNPRAVFEYLLEKYGDKLEYVWNISSLNTDIPDSVKNNAILVSHNSLRSSYYKATSAVWCFNHRNTRYFHKKKNQYYIQTWHGDIVFKLIEKSSFKEKNLKLSKYFQKCLVDSKHIDLLLCGSEWGYNNLKSNFFVNHTNLALLGSPRNDVLINKDKENLKYLIRKRYGVSDEVKICLYAPTFRKNFSLVDMLFSNNNEFVTQLREALKKRFKGEWIIMVKYHPASLGNSEASAYFDDKTIINASDYPDTAEILVAVDALISDFSSIAFDFCLSQKPCWLYWEDLDDYVKTQGELAIAKDEVGFDVCMSKPELIDKIIQFDNGIYKENIVKMLNYFGSKEIGTACQSVCDKISSFMKIDNI